MLTIATSTAIKISGSIGQLRGEAIDRATVSAEVGEAAEERDFLDINKKIKGLIQGDVVPRRQNNRNTITNTLNYWPSTTIPIYYGSELSLEAIGSIELARQEYRLRTCLNFVDRSNERDYISFQSFDGCWSYIGVVGGSQYLSIGSGCENMGIVCHEMMHAIGIWHEQSRPDRDDYVQIEWQNVESGHEHNFNKYDFDTADPRRVPYDYNSVMHYSASGFSVNGNPTIVTRDPAFQTLIGQRKTFSKGDTEKINRMYQCSDTLLYSYNCNFDDEAMCGFFNDYTDDTASWIPYTVGDKTVTVPLSAPTLDSTQGLSSQGAYMILDTTSKVNGQIGEVRSMRHLSKATEQCLQFSYYVDKDYNSNAAVSVNLGTLNDKTGEVTGSQPLVTITDDTEGKWRVQRMTLKAPSAYRLIFSGKTSPYEDTIAIDDVSVQDKTCEDGFFITEDYSTILESYKKGESFLSPVMTSTQGYNFRVLIYPQGVSFADDGYMSMYFGLVQGPNDSNLKWPFCNQYIRMMVVDQNDDPLYGLNKYHEFLTSPSNGGDLWNQPTSDTSAGYWGYSNFMKIDELQGSTKNYLKLDRLMVSVLVKDMNEFAGGFCSGTFSRSLAGPVPKNSDDAEAAGGFADSEVEGEDLRISDDEDGHKHSDDDEDCHGHEDYDHDGYITVGAAAGIAIGVALLVFIVMAAIMCCGFKSHRKQAKVLTNNAVVHPQVPHTSATAPLTYTESEAANGKLPLPNV